MALQDHGSYKAPTTNHNIKRCIKIKTGHGIAFQHKLFHSQTDNNEGYAILQKLKNSRV